MLWLRHVALLIGSEQLSDAEGDPLLEHCRHRPPISGSVNDQVLTPATGRCECCGARLLFG
jgi:hypothetical protein